MPNVLIDSATRQILGLDNGKGVPAPGYARVEITDTQAQRLYDAAPFLSATLGLNGIVTITPLPLETDRSATRSEMVTAWNAAETVVDQATATYQAAVTAYQTAANTATTSINALPNSATKTALQNLGTAVTRLATATTSLATALNQVDNVKLQILAELASAAEMRRVNL